jgi:hypothetical protein
MRAMLGIALSAVAVWCSVGAMAKAPAQTQSLIVAVNQALAQFASASQMGIRYRDVEHVRNPIAGNYLAFLDVELRVEAHEASYIVQAPRITLQQTDAEQYRLAIPASARLVVDAQGQHVPYRLGLAGAPHILLRHDPWSGALMVKFAAKEAAFAPTLRALGADHSRATHVTGRMTLAQGWAHSEDWQPITPVSAEQIAAQIRALCSDFNRQLLPRYPGYFFQGCVWSRR